MSISIEKSAKIARDYYNKYGYVSSRHLIKDLKLDNLEATLDILEHGIKKFSRESNPIPSKYLEVDGHFCLVYYKPDEKCKCTIE